MANIGDIIHASKLGKKHQGYYTWAICPDCNNGRWLRNDQIGKTITCFKCNRMMQSGSKHPGWKGGRIMGNDAYIDVIIYPDSPYYEMGYRRNAATKVKYIREHRLVVAQHLGRLLLKHEHVHHINGDTTDNRLENLKLMSRRDHGIINHLCANCELRKEIRLLRLQISHLQEQLNYKLV